jgi:hypothetical protein
LAGEWRRAFLDVFFWQQAALTLAVDAVVARLGPARLL